MTWNYLKGTEFNWNHLEQGGPCVTRWTRQQTDSKNKKIHSKKQCVRYYFSIGYIVSNSYCDKDSILAGGTTWNRMEAVSADTKNALCTVSLAHRYSLQNTSCQKEVYLRC